MKEVKICKTCGLEKTLEHFPLKGKYVSLHCRNCQSKKTGAYLKANGYRTYKYRRATNLAYEKRNRDKVYARLAVKVAVRLGNLVRQPCFCGETNVQAHHHKGYAKENRLDVIWLCQKHHSEQHYSLTPTP